MVPTTWCTRIRVRRRQPGQGRQLVLIPVPLLGVFPTLHSIITTRHHNRDVSGRVSSAWGTSVDAAVGNHMIRPQRAGRGGRIVSKDRHGSFRKHIQTSCLKDAGPCFAEAIMTPIPSARLLPTRENVPTFIIKASTTRPLHSATARNPGMRNENPRIKFQSRKGGTSQKPIASVMILGEGSHPKGRIRSQPTAYGSPDTNVSATAHQT